MKTNSTDLESLIKQAKELGADSELRLFACWCARQTESSDIRWVSVVDLAERFAQGQAEAGEMASRREDLSNAAIAAGTVGIKARASNAYTMLAAFQTLRPDAAEAASLAAEEHRMWARNKAEKMEGLTWEETRIVGQTIQTIQADKLREMLQTFDQRREEP